MAFHFNDNINTKSFTPREYQIELLDAAKERNVIVCLATGPGKIFIATKLIQDLSNTVRIPYSDGGLRTLYLVDTLSSVAQQASYIRHLTDLSVEEYNSFDSIETWDCSEWKKQLLKHQVLVMRSDICLHLLKTKFLTMDNLNLLVLDECHRAVKVHPLRQIMKEYYSTSVKQPRVLGLTAPLLNSNCDPGRLEAEIQRLESVLYSSAETASDIVTILRYCNRPKELLVECAPPVDDNLSQTIRNEITSVQEFLKDHRYAPLELYDDDEYREELQGIPDPKIDPEKLLEDFLNVLNTLGPYCADKAAFVILIQIERLKVKVPYERHFLLLCVVSSVLVKIRATCDHTFRQYDEKSKIYTFSSPKILRLLEVLRYFKSEKPVEEKQTSIALTNENVIEESQINKQENVCSIKQKTEPCSHSTVHNKCSDDDELQSDIVNAQNCTINCNEDEVNSIPSQHDNEQCELHNKDTITPKETTLENCENKSIPNQLNNGYSEAHNTDIVTSKETTPENSEDKNISALELVVQELVENSCKSDGCSGDTTSETGPNVPKTPDKVVDLDHSNNLINGMVSPKNSVQDVKWNEVKFSSVAPVSGRSDFIPRSRFAKYRRGLYKDDGQGRIGKPELNHRLHRNLLNDDVDALCGLILVRERFTAKILFHLLSEIRKHDEEFSFLMPQYTVDKIADPLVDCREAEAEHRKQEEVLKRFRMRECNLLIGTSVLEEGIDMPKCNLVIRFDLPLVYRSYVQSKGRARAQDAYYILMTDKNMTSAFVKELAQYIEIEQLLLRKCDNREPSEEEEEEADKYTYMVGAYEPKDSPTKASVNMATAIALVNRYCAKLPSDTFTRLTPLCTMKVVNKTQPAYVCTVRLPINSPMKQDIIGLPMPSRVLARRIAALKTCCVLHNTKELDNNLLPVGKESFRLHEEEETMLALEEIEEMVPRDSNEPRPGTTKRRQYYYKRIAQSLTDCRPVPGRPSYLYFISMVLTCPLPEEQNTRGRKIYPPEESPQGFGVLTLRQIPKICAFPIFTRSGEVRVELELSDSHILLTENKVKKIETFLNYTFTSVLRLQKYLMLFDPQASENSYFIVPTKKFKGGAAEVDWEFLDRIYEDRDLRPIPVPEEERKNFVFDSPKYHDAVIMPWYRNQDQPQYFYVAEICSNLNPKSTFPGSEYKTFDEYYMKKYNIQIQNTKQPLLDVDHTSARLNFLTPRYVNRKGVALPTSSEETKRAKRENLEQKQILVPELCTVHPFPASLWRKAVCLPCVLYRINALLLADQIRRQVANSISLGQEQLPVDFEWRPLDFGWCLADVLQKSKENAIKNDTTKEELAKKPIVENISEPNDSGDNESAKTLNQILTEEEKKLRGDWMEIGTWSNEMADNPVQNHGYPDTDYFDPSTALPSNLTMVGEDSDLMSLDSGGLTDWAAGIKAQGKERVRYGSPSSWMGSGGFGGLEQDLEGFETDDSSEPDYYDKSESSDNEGSSGLRIQFKGHNEAEAVEDEQETEKRERRLILGSTIEEELMWEFDSDESIGDQITEKCIRKFEAATLQNQEIIQGSGKLVKSNEPVNIVRKCKDNSTEPVTVVAENNNSAVEHYKTVDGITFTCNVLPDFVAQYVCDKDLNIVSSLEDANFTLVNLSVNNYFNGDSKDSEDDEDTASKFSFDIQPDLKNHPGPSPSLILQALTMSNANDGINLERLETIGDSFLKYAITTYLYCTYENIHEGKLSHLRSKQVSNLNLYRLGRRKVFGESMIATKFEPHDNWLPPCYYVPRELEQALIEAGVPASHWNQADLPALRDMSRDEICQLVRERSEKLKIIDTQVENIDSLLQMTSASLNIETLPCFIPYNLITQHSIPDKSLADCVEALIGAYLIACGPRGALIFMAWLGICVLPKEEKIITKSTPFERPVGSMSLNDGDSDKLICYGQLKPPRSPLLRNIPQPEVELERLLDGYDVFEQRIGYHFADRSYLLQALTHASYSPNRLTDCYQRLEFLGDAVLDYLITRHLYEDSRQHSPGALTDLRSALVNNTIFASLAVRYGFHKYFRHLSPGLNEVVDRFVRIQEENGHTISEEYYLIGEEECEEAEDVEVPKALGDVFESVAGAIFLDSKMSLDAVWRVYYRMMKLEIEQFSTNVPKSPIRDLLELEPETAKFGKPEKLADGRRVRVTVEVFGKGTYKGIGRNYRIAKCTAAKCALKQLKKRGLLAKKQ